MSGRTSAPARHRAVPAAPAGAPAGPWARLLPAPLRARRTALAQAARFALVGAVNTGTYYAFYLAMLHGAGLPYVVAHVIAFILSMIGSFFLNSWFTYRTRPTLRKFLLFPLTNVANFVITTGGVYLLVDRLGMNDSYAPLVAAVAAIPITFVVSRTIMLRPDPR